MVTKLQFKLTTMNAEEVYLAEPYKVKHYDWRKVNGSIVEKPCWHAYYRVYDKASKSMLFGDSVEKLSMYESKPYETKEEAIEACQKHYENQ